MSLRHELENTDEIAAIKNMERRTFFGYLHCINMTDEINIVAFTEASFRWYHEVLKRDLCSLTQRSLFKNVTTYKKLLYYTLVARHPFAGYPPVAVAEYITSDHSKESVSLFLLYVRAYEKKIYVQNSIGSPTILLLDSSLVLIGAALHQLSVT